MVRKWRETRDKHSLKRVTDRHSLMHPHNEDLAIAAVNSIIMTLLTPQRDFFFLCRTFVMEND